MNIKNSVSLPMAK